MILWIVSALAGPETGVQKLLDTGKLDKAQVKCQRMNAQLPHQPRPLREACAKAMWIRAEHTDTYAAWVAFGADWAGTSYEKSAHEHAAKAKLRVLGDTASELIYTEFLNEFPNTVHTQRAKELQAAAACREVSSKEQAVRAAKLYPTFRGLENAIQPYFAAFVHLDTTGDDIAVRLDPELPIPGAQLTATWSGVFEGEPVPLNNAAIQHLTELGVPKALAQQYANPKRQPPYPPCSAPRMKLGVHVVYDSLSSFHPVERICGGTDPAFLAEEDGRVVGLTLTAGIDYRFGDGDRPNLEWVHRDLRTSIPLLGTKQPEVLIVGPVLGQQVGPFWLLHPLAGGMPWYVKEEPPPSAKPLPSTLISSPVPDGIQLVGTSTGDTRIERNGAPHWTRSLPPGKVRVVSRWLSAMTGLHDKNPVFERAQVDPLPYGFQPNWQPLPDIVDRTSARTALAGFGITLTRAWSVALQDKGEPEILFEGRFKGDAVKGVLDPRPNGSHRLFVFHSPRTGDPLVFTHAGRIWVGFRGEAGLEMLCFGPRGLLRRLNR